MYKAKIERLRIFKSRNKKYKGKVLKRFKFHFYIVKCVDPNNFGKPVFQFYTLRLISIKTVEREMLSTPTFKKEELTRIKTFSLPIAGAYAILDKILEWKTGMQRIICIATPNDFDPFNGRFQIGTSIHNPKDKFDIYTAKCESIDCIFRMKRLTMSGV